MASDVLCAQCDLPEWKCKCDRYCGVCKSWDNVSLCTDGQYYCEACREACDVEPAKPNPT
jgi:hypothetical protein